MKEFIEKLIGRLEEYNNANDSMEIQIAKNYAKCLVEYGVDIRDKWETATSQSMALNQAYLRGRQNERDRFAEWQDEHEEKVMIDGQYCWQTCGATEHCKECNRLCNGSIDYYENYAELAEEYKDDCCEWKVDGVYLMCQHKTELFVSCLEDEKHRYKHCPICGKKIKAVE